jgi:hypothetical protein
MARSRGAIASAALDAPLLVAARQAPPLQSKPAATAFLKTRCQLSPLEKEMRDER